MTTFNKPEKSNSDLIIEWKKRGLLIPDEQRALRYLDFYQLLSPFCLFYSLPNFSITSISNKYEF